MKKILLIIPAYNESANIVNVYSTIKEYNEKADNIKLDYVIINDGSTDNTLEICKKYDMNVIDLITNLGIGGAVQTGYLYAYQNGYDIAVQFDGDGQHDVNYVVNICKPIIEGSVDLCIGSRYLNSESSEFKSTFMRRFGKNIISLIIKLCTGVKITDPTSGFRAVNNDIMKLFSVDYPTDYPEPESIVNVIKNGYKVTETPVSMNERIGGKSSINFLKSAHYMIKVSISIIIDSLRTTKKKGKVK